MRVHVIQTGNVVFREAALEDSEHPGRSILKALFRPKRMSIPIHAYVVEHPDGLVMIDTGLHAGLVMPRVIRWLGDLPAIEPSEEVGPQMRAKGFRPEDVRWVIPTHLHLDHAGGLHHFPDAELLVHRTEFEKTGFDRRADYRHVWPDWLDPKLYDLEPEPYHGFPSHKRLAADIRFVPIPGHSPGQVGILIDTDGPTLFFCGDHTLTQEMFVEDYAAGRHTMGGMLGDRKAARETSRNIATFLREVPSVLVPAHDHTVAARLAERSPVTVG